MLAHRQMIALVSRTRTYGLCTAPDPETDGPNGRHGTRGTVRGARCLGRKLGHAFEAPTSRELHDLVVHLTTEHVRGPGSERVEPSYAGLAQVGLRAQGALPGVEHAVPPGESRGTDEIKLRRLVKEALRMRPPRIVGERCDRRKGPSCS